MYNKRQCLYVFFMQFPIDWKTSRSISSKVSEILLRDTRKVKRLVWTASKKISRASLLISMPISNPPKTDYLFAHLGRISSQSELYTDADLSVNWGYLLPTLKPRHTASVPYFISVYFFPGKVGLYDYSGGADLKLV
jgi:hypothetical protein